MNFKIKGGKVHRWAFGSTWFYVCGVSADIGDIGTNPDKRTTKPVTCKNCLRIMEARK